MPSKLKLNNINSYIRGCTYGEPFSDPTLYRSLAGVLKYLNFTWPEISYAVQQECLCMIYVNHIFLLWIVILRYIQGTLCTHLPHRLWVLQLIRMLTGDSVQTISRSTPGYCVFLGANLLSWSAKQPTLSRSSSEAEYHAVANVVTETSWLRNLLLELHCPLRKPMIVYCDNISAVYLSYISLSGTIFK